MSERRRRRSDLGRKHRRRPLADDASAATGASSRELPPLPSLDAPTEPRSSDAAIAALAQSGDAGDASSATDANSAGTITGGTDTGGSAARDASSATRASASSSIPPAGDRPGDRPKPIALEARELRGMQVRELRTMLVTERRRNAELIERLERESPIAQAALDADLQQGIAETATLVSEGVAFLIDEPLATLPPKTAERLGRVWAPIAKRYLGPTLAEHFPLYVAITATLAAVMDRTAEIKEARELRRELMAGRWTERVSSSTPPASAPASNGTEHAGAVVVRVP